MSDVTLVVGADGQIGSALVARLTRAGRPVVTTSRREGAVGRRLILDLADDPARWSLPDGIASAFLFAAITSLQECESDPLRTARVNVANLSTLAAMLVERGAMVLFPSTNLVFDGSAPRRRADDPVSPETEYGRQKAAAERALLELDSGRVAIVRLTKVLGPGDRLLGDWIASLRRGEAIRPFCDKVMAPVGLGRAVDVLLGVAEARLAGITQVSASRDLTYAEAAEFLRRRLGAGASLVQPRAAHGAGLRPSAAPRHTTLCTRRMTEELGVKAPDPYEALEEVLEC
jgi:dTDP-4-dehydrorhamnose reductase